MLQRASICRTSASLRIFENSALQQELDYYRSELLSYRFNKEIRPQASSLVNRRFNQFNDFDPTPSDKLLGLSFKGYPPATRS